ncbi:MAG: CocE/NonD family hydrolase C-terminal non-catalytic domain-containing protein [Alphaproteobacteria bacterium]
MSGHTKLRVWVSMDVGLDMDLFVAIRKIDKDGKVVLFDNHHAFVPVATRGWLRVSERKLDPARSTPWRPFLSHDEPLPGVPGERIPVDSEILPSSTFFEAGSELVLTIKGRDITAERGFQHKILMNQGRHTVWSGGQFDSHLLLPIVPAAVEGEAKR